MSNGNGHRTETPDVSHIRNVEVTHEPSDINAGAVLRFLGVLTALTVVVSIGLWFMFKYLNTEKAKERPPGPMAIRNATERLPPEPRLQGSKGFRVTLEDGREVPLELTHPQAEYEVLREQWESALATGVKDSSGNTVGMPINEAMKKVLSGQGLPVRATQAPNTEQREISIPTDASSGRHWVKLK